MFDQQFLFNQSSMQVTSAAMLVKLAACEAAVQLLLFC
jgi:hypothetical protein